MRARYSDLKALVPGLSASAREVGEALTRTGFMMDEFVEATTLGKPDWIVGFEVRQNRADGFSTIGIAREVGAYYRLPLALPSPPPVPAGLPAVPVAVDSPAVRRVEVARFSGVRNGPSPAWLSEFLVQHAMEPINLLVDLSNYVMLYTGYPSHVIDSAKMQGTLAWSHAPRAAKVQTLAGTEVDLAAAAPMVIQDDRNVISVSAIVGTRYAEVGEDATDVVIEMAVYDPAQIRRDSRATDAVTEASRRLEKFLDPSGTGGAFALLVSLVTDLAGGTVAGTYSYGAADAPRKELAMRLSAPASMAGIGIGPEESEEILAALGFSPRREGESLVVTVPPYRTDILDDEEDVVEEVIRLYGFDRIPSDVIPALPVTPHVPQPALLLADRFRDELAAIGFDETLSSPMVAEADNRAAYRGPGEMVVAENAVNDEFPAMRQTLGSGLLAQARLYVEKGVDGAAIFEVGRVFSKVSGAYEEHDACALLLQGTQGVMRDVQEALERMLRQAGVRSVGYAPLADAPQTANPHAAWEVSAEGEAVGVLYKVVLAKDLRARKDAAYGFFEVDVDRIARIIAALPDDKAVAEIEGKLVTLDANVELPEGASVDARIGELRAALGGKAWEIRVTDAFALPAGTRYTLRVSYLGLPDPEAKALHRATFG